LFAIRVSVGGRVAFVFISFSATELHIGEEMNGVTDYLFKRLRIKLSILIITTFLLGGGLIGKVYADIPTIERAALIAVYNSTDGDSWRFNTGWNGALGTECTWYGVTCSGDHVTRLYLSYNQLTGSIPAELGNLTNLQELSLYYNQLTDSIPAELGNLTNLRELSLYYNQLTGSIPAELGNLTNLQELYLDGNQLTGSIPAELGNLTNLQELYLSYNQLTGNIPAELGNLIYLELLSLESNQLTGSIPVELMNMDSLYYINICGNKLYTSDLDLRNFLNSLQPEWESCQAKAIFKAMPWIPLLLLDH